MTDEKRADIVLQGLPSPEYDMIRYNAGADPGAYDLPKIVQIARNIWYNRNRNNGAGGSGAARRGHRSSARNAGFTATAASGNQGQSNGRYSREQQCYHCHKLGHIKRDCPDLADRRARDDTSSSTRANAGDRGGQRGGRHNIANKRTGQRGGAR